MKKKSGKRLWRKALACLLAATMLGGMSVMVSAADVTTPFDDVTGKDTTEAVARLVAAGITNGKGDGKFDPDGELTRAEFMTLLGRCAGAEADQAAEPSFTDVVNDGWSAGYIAWGVENGLIEGYGDGTFGQYDTLTEEQVNAIIARYNEKFGTRVPSYNAPSGNATRRSAAILLAAGYTYEFTDPVAVTGGEIRGYKSYDGEINIYKGIPYAASPEGENRWKEPQPVESWTGVRDCTTWGASAIQSAQAPFMMWSTEYIIEDTGYSEDCLTLNIWSKDDDTQSKPVIVYIHGGGFTSGGSSCEVYNGEYMASQDVVFVNINYRVGVLGFMAHPELDAEAGHSGNYGVLDAIQALEWVKENIAQFGGDPSNVTIMGQSAGSGVVNALVQSPLAQGLFTGAVAESYNSINGELQTSGELGETYAELFAGYTLEELRAMSVEELTAIDNSGSLCVDGYVLMGQYADDIADGVTNDVPLMTGMVEGDTLLFGFLSDVEDEESYVAAVREKFGENADKALELYPASDYAANVTRMAADNSIALQQVLASVRASGGESGTYVYFMTYVQPGPDSAAYGAFHTSDVPYFFNVFSNCRAEYWTDADYSFGNTMSSYLLNFARTGDPNGEGLAQWTASDGMGAYMDLDADCAMESLSAEKLELFNAYYADILG